MHPCYRRGRGSDRKWGVADEDCQVGFPKGGQWCTGSPSPGKSLGQQEDHRWSHMLRTAAPDKKVGRIDGSVARSSLLNVLRNSSLVVMTPDIIHAWVLPSLG